MFRVKFSHFFRVFVISYHLILRVNGQKVVEKVDEQSEKLSFPLCLETDEKFASQMIPKKNIERRIKTFDVGKLRES